MVIDEICVKCQVKISIKKIFCQQNSQHNFEVFQSYIPIPISVYRLISLVGRVFANGPGDLGSIPGQVIPKTLKMVLIPPCLTLSNIRCISRVNWSNPGKGVAPSPTSWCSSYRNGSLLVALDDYILMIKKNPFLLHLYQFLHTAELEKPTSLATLHCRLHSEMNFTILSIVLIDSSFVWSTFSFKLVCSTAFWGVQDLSFNSRSICISRIKLVFFRHANYKIISEFFLNSIIFSSGGLVKKYTINVNNLIYFV